MEEQKTCYSPSPFNGFNNGRQFISEIFDSGEAKTEWDRLKLEIQPLTKKTARINTILRVYIFEDKKCIPEKPIITSQYTDILLYGSHVNDKYPCISGRYLYFKVSLLGEEKVNFNAYELTFPKLTFTKYLPAIYQKNEQLDRFLAVYQNQYLDAERAIMNFHRNLNVRQTDMLNWLVGLICGEMFLDLPEKILRKLLGVIALLYKTKGTKNCIKRLVYCLTDEVPTIIDCADELVENERNVFSAKNGHFYLMLKSRPDIDLELFNYLIKQFIPINTHYTTVFLNENRTIGNFCFLGINSTISNKKQPIVGTSILGEDLRL
jgi:phage tail-like protein